MKVFTIEELAASCKVYIYCADEDGIELDDDNVIDLCADQFAQHHNDGTISQPSLNDIRDALVCLGLAPRFPNATRKHRYE